MYIHIHMYIYTFIFVYTYMYIHISMYSHIYVWSWRTPRRKLLRLRAQVYLTKRVLKVVLQKSTPFQIRQLILYYY